MEEQHAGQKPMIKLVEEQSWLTPLGQKSDALVESALERAGGVGEAAEDVLVNSRLLGHKKHPTITDVPLGSWTVTVVSDALNMCGYEPCADAADVSIGVGLAASVMASLGGLADLRRTHNPSDRRLGMMHGVLHGVTMLLFGSSFTLRRNGKRALGRTLSFAGYGTLLVSSYLASELSLRQNVQAAQEDNRSNQQS